MRSPRSMGPLLLPAGSGRRLGLLGVASLVFTLLLWFVWREAAWSALIVAGQIALGLALGALVFLAFGHVTKAGWMAAIKRVPEGMAGALPHVGIAVLLILLVSLGAYEWSHEQVVEADPLLAHKRPWLNQGGVVLRAVIALAAWSVFALWLRRLSRKQDTTPGPGPTRKAVAVSCGFLATLAVTYSMTSFDWLMSLEAHWFSTVYAIYCFSGVFLAGAAGITLLAIRLRRSGPLRGLLRDEHLHDLGKLLFAFSTFWAYIWFCQYMLIWYSHIPEETAWYVPRMSGAWAPWMLANVVVNWLLPFLLLLPRAAKRSERTMARVAALLLFGRVLDLHLLVAPPLVDAPWTILLTLVPTAGLLIGFLCVVERRLRAAPLEPAGDPYLAESLGYHA